MATASRATWKSGQSPGGQFAEGARRAKEAGFDGVEVHGANGYLIDQFLRDGSNRRGDEYGGSAANRARFLLEVTEAVVSVWGPERVGVRLSPLGSYNDMADSDPAATFSHAARELSARRVGYLHIVEAIKGPMAVAGQRLTPLLREHFRGHLVANGGYDAPSAHAARPISSRSARSFWPTPTCPSASASARPSTRPTRRRSTPAAIGATSTTRPSPDAGARAGRAAPGPRGSRRHFGVRYWSGSGLSGASLSQ